jgi:2Fe-2S ferredoxin
LFRFFEEEFMVAINVTDRMGKLRKLEASGGGSLMEVLRDNDCGVEAICGGSCSCATCHVFIGSKWASKLPPRSADEYDLLIATGSFRPDESRLSCQIPLSDDVDGLEVTVAAED